jgi:acyl carrier protein
MYEVLRGILIDDLHLSASDLQPNASCEDAGLDSLALVELSMILNKQLKVDINDDELLAATGVADIVRMLEERVHHLQRPGVFLPGSTEPT